MLLFKNNTVIIEFKHFAYLRINVFAFENNIGTVETIYNNTG